MRLISIQERQKRRGIVELLASFTWSLPASTGNFERSEHRVPTRLFRTELEDSGKKRFCHVCYESNRGGFLVYLLHLFSEPGDEPPNKWGGDTVSSFKACPDCRGELEARVAVFQGLLQDFAPSESSFSIFSVLHTGSPDPDQESREFRTGLREDMLRDVNSEYLARSRPLF